MNADFVSTSLHSVFAHLYLKTSGKMKINYGDGNHTESYFDVQFTLYCVTFGFTHQVESEFILESERESFIDQVREVIETADERGLEREGSQVLLVEHLGPFYLLY